MNNIPMTVNSISLLPDCWLYQNKRFLLYRATFDGLLEYWDASNYKEEELTLPLYISLPEGAYLFTPNYTGKIPTQASVIAANNLIPKVDKAVQFLDQNRI